MEKLIPKHQFKNINSISLTLIVIAIISNVHLVKSNELITINSLTNEGAIPVFKFENTVNNVMQVDDSYLFVAGLNNIYLLKDEYSKPNQFMKKAFFSESKNQHLITSSFKNQSLNKTAQNLTVIEKKLDCSSFNSSDCKTEDEIENKNRILVKIGKNPSIFFRLWYCI